MPAYARTQPARHKSLIPVAGGALVLVAGILALVMGAFYLAMDVQDIENSGVTIPPEISEEDLQTVLTVCGALCVVFGILAIVGGYFALIRKHFGLGIVGGIFGILGLGFVFGSVLALIGLILIAVGRREFD